MTISDDKSSYRYTFTNPDDLAAYSGQYDLWPLHVKDWQENFEGSFKRFSPMPSLKDFRKHALVGLSKIVEDIDEILDDDFLKLYLASAYSQVEMELGIYLTELEQTISFDFIEGLFGPRYSGMTLPQWPVTQILGVKLKSSHTMSDNPVSSLDIPPTWISFRNRKLNIMADIGNIRFSSGTGQGAVMPWISGFTPGPYRPNVIEVQCRVGFPEDKFPVILADIVLTQATIALLTDATPVLFPYSSVSTGIDGVSQSASLPGPQFLVMRIGMLEKLLAKKKAAITAAMGQSLKFTVLNT